MKTLLAWAFFAICTVVMAAGVAMASSGKGLWLMALSFAAYTALFIKFGCLPSEH